MMNYWLNLLTIFSLFIGGALAQDPTKSLPDSYQTIFENTYVRIQRVHYPPHIKLPKHDHTSYATAYVYLNDAGPILYKHIGLSYGAVTRPAVKAGSFRLYVAVKEIHEVESLSDTPSDFLRIELKTEPGTNPNSFRGKYFRIDAPPNENFQQIQFENEQIRITRIFCAAAKSFSFPANATVPSLLVAVTNAQFNPLKLKQGQVHWLATNKSLEAINTSKEAAEFLRFEFKTAPLKTAPNIEPHEHLAPPAIAANEQKEKAKQEAARLLIVGVALHNEGKITEAIATQEKALQLNPELLQAYVNLISLYGQTKQYDKGETSYQAAIAINPDIPEIYYNYGVLLAVQDRFSEAEKTFARCLELNPYHADAHHNYASLIERTGRLNEAATHYRKAIENKSDYSAAHFALGRILANQNQLPEAIAQFKLSLTPASEFTPRNLYALGATYIHAGNRTEGINYLREALKQAKALQQDALANSIANDLKTLEQN